MALNAKDHWFLDLNLEHPMIFGLRHARLSVATNSSVKPSQKAVT